MVTTTAGFQGPWGEGRAQMEGGKAGLGSADGDDVHTEEEGTASPSREKLGLGAGGNGVFLECRVQGCRATRARCLAGSCLLLPLCWELKGLSPAAPKPVSPQTAQVGLDLSPLPSDTTRRAGGCSSVLHGPLSRTRGPWSPGVPLQWTPC